MMSSGIVYAAEENVRYYAGGKTLYIVADGDGTYLCKDEDGEQKYTKYGDITGQSIFGGSPDGEVQTTNLVMVSGEVANLFGGGWSGEEGTTHITIKGGTIGAVYGGGYNTDTAKTNITISGGSVDWVFGGGASGTVENTSVTICGDAEVGHIYGGGYEGSVTNATVDVSEKADIGYLYGGGYDGPTTKATVKVEGGYMTAATCANDADHGDCNAKLTMTGGEIQTLYPGYCGTEKASAAISGAGKVETDYVNIKNPTTVLETIAPDKTIVGILGNISQPGIPDEEIDPDYTPPGTKESPTSSMKPSSSEAPSPTVSDSEEPSPSAKPTAKPTTKPSPTAKPTTKPSPTAKPTTKPSPTANPTTKPSPTAKPTTKPSPTAKPTTKPSPTAKPTTKPSPTANPTTKPSPTAKPTAKPSPTASASVKPSPSASASVKPASSTSPSGGGSSGGGGGGGGGGSSGGGGSGGGGGSSSSGGHSSGTSTTQIAGNVMNMSQSVVASSDGVASLSSSILSSAAKTAAQEAKKQGKTPTLTLVIESSSKLNRVQGNVGRDGLKAADENGIETITLQSRLGWFTLNRSAYRDIYTQSQGATIQFSISKVNDSASRTDFSDAQKQEAKNKSVYELSIKNGNQYITRFAGTMTVTLPYSLQEGERAGGVDVWHLGEDGSIQSMAAAYDQNTHNAVFHTNHLSCFMVGYQAWANPFADVRENDWFYDSVAFVCRRGLFQGTGAEKFEPTTQMSRAMFVTVLWRYAGEPNAAQSAFVDLEADSWYTKAVHWAAENGIVQGSDGVHFNPDGEITREQIATILYRYSQKYALSLPMSVPLRAYEDQNEISAWAKDAMNWAIQTGLFTGRTETRLESGATAQRSEMATVLTRFTQAAGR